MRGKKRGGPCFLLKKVTKLKSVRNFEVLVSFSCRGTSSEGRGEVGGEWARDWGHSVGTVQLTLTGRAMPGSITYNKLALHYITFSSQFRTELSQNSHLPLPCFSISPSLRADSEDKIHQLSDCSRRAC